MLTMKLQLMTAAMIGQFTVGPPLPLDIDHLKAPFGEKRVALILDVSGSMDWGDRALTCAWFNSRTSTPPYFYNTGPTTMNKNEQMKAALVGCNLENDGVLDAWASQVDFAITSFGWSTPPYVRQEMGGVFTRDLSLLQNTVLTLPAVGSTPMQWGLLEGGKQHNDYWGQPHPNEFECDQHFNVLMTDGVPNDCGDSGNMAFNPICDTPGYNQVPCGAAVNFTPFVPPPGGSGFYTGPTFMTPYRYAPPFMHYNYCVDPAQCDVVGAAGYFHYDNELPDSVCRQVAGLEDGIQNITTYTIGFGNPGDLDENLLRAVAARGGGNYYGAQDAQALSAAFNEILNAIIARTASFSPPSISTDGLYVGNDAYTASFKAVSGRPWIGNLKRYCVNPRLINGTYEAESANNNCLFVHRTAPPGYPASGRPTYLETNEQPYDPWAAGRSLEADAGGAGFKILQDYFGGNVPNYNAGNSAAFTSQFGGMSQPIGQTQLDFYNNSRPHRKIITWDPTSRTYVDLYTLTDTELMASGCHKTRLLAYMYGYDPNTVDCVNHVPTQIGIWPLGASVNAHPTILRWAADCNGGANRCVVALNMDDGGIHFFDTFDGHEHSVLVPRELLTPRSSGNYPLAAMLDQPMRELSRRPYLDGPMFRVHDDKNANGIIDGSETAYLVWGLGHGGSAYYFMDVHTPFQVPSATSNAVYPITATPNHWTANMRDSMAQPWVGRVRYNATQPPVLTAVIPSGHVWYMDRPDAEFDTDAIGLRPPMNPAITNTVDCATFAAYNNLGATFDVCNGAYSPPIPPFFPGGYTDLGVVSACGSPPSDARSPAIWYANGIGTSAPIAGAIGQITFSNFDLDPGDYVVIEDLGGHELTPRLTGTLASIPAGNSYVWNVWITQRPFIIRLHVDGVCNTNTGIAIQSFQWIPDRLWGGCGGGNPCEGCDVNDNGNCTSSPGECNPGSSQAVLQACSACDTDKNGNCAGVECNHLNAGGFCGVHDPFVAFIDLTLINGPNAVSGSPAAQQYSTQTLNGSAPLLFTRTCPPSAAGFTGECYDQNRSTGAGATVGTADLQYMDCPIIAEVRAYEEGGVGKAFYVGDQCGQMWKFWTDNNGTDWNAKRLFNANNLTTAGLESRVYRRFDRPVDLVLSQCKGNRSIGVYFGTGNTARPAARDNLELPVADANLVTSVSASSLIRSALRVRNHNVVGVFFDGNQWNSGTSRTLSDLQDVTPANATENPVQFQTANDGWFWALRDDEQMLRDPLVFQGVAYFKTNEGRTDVTTCKPGTTIDRAYAVNNCTSLPALTGNYLDSSGNNITPLSGTAGREVWVGEQDVGGNLLLYTPKEGPPIVSVGDTSGHESASLIPPKANARTLEMLMRWRVF